MGVGEVECLYVCIIIMILLFIVMSFSILCVISVIIIARGVGYAECYI